MTTVGYTTTEEVARVLKLRTPSTEQQAALVRVLTSALVEITSEIDLADDATPLTNDQKELAAEVQIERAVEHWQQGGAPFGLIGLGAETGVAFASTDSWARHAKKLASLKNQQGFA